MRTETTLYFGSKSIELFQFAPDISTYTFRGDIKTTLDPRIQGETTEIYRQVGEYLEKKARDLKHPVRYVFFTDNENLIKWAEMKTPWKWELQHLAEGVRAEIIFGRQSN